MMSMGSVHGMAACARLSGYEWHATNRSGVRRSDGSRGYNRHMQFRAGHCTVEASTWGGGAQGKGGLKEKRRGGLLAVWSRVLGVSWACANR